MGRDKISLKMEGVRSRFRMKVSGWIGLRWRGATRSIAND